VFVLQRDAVWAVADRIATTAAVYIETVQMFGTSVKSVNSTVEIRPTVDLRA